jgi:hypothetical protein
MDLEVQGKLVFPYTLTYLEIRMYLESNVETLLLMKAHVPLLRGSAEFTLIHAEGQNNFGSLGDLRIWT